MLGGLVFEVAESFEARFVFLEVGVLKSLSVLFPDITKDLNISSGELGIYTAISHGITISLGKELYQAFAHRSRCTLKG